MNHDQAELLISEVRQMRSLLELLAEPAIAQRDAKLRDELRRVVGVSARKQQSVLLMDGSRTQKQIISETSVHGGDLSTLIGKLEQSGLLADGRKQPKLVITIPANFFDASAEPNRR
jgi:hypothetical protein